MNTDMKPSSTAKQDAGGRGLDIAEVVGMDICIVTKYIQERGAGAELRNRGSEDLYMAIPMYIPTRQPQPKSERS